MALIHTTITNSFDEAEKVKKDAIQSNKIMLDNPSVRLISGTGRSTIETTDEKSGETITVLTVAMQEHR